LPQPSPRHCEPTGRRKAPPDDRLREAIDAAALRHCERSEAIHVTAKKKKHGLLRRFAPRNDKEEEVCHNPLPVLASEAKQSIAPAKKKDGFFVALLLAMTM
jgi:hypothetical protein